MKNYEIYCGGKFVTSNQKLETKNPFCNEVFATTYLASTEQLNNAIEAATSVQKQLAQLSSYERADILMQIANDLFLQRDYFASILSQESAKPIKYALAEIDRSIQTFKIAAEECKRLPKEYISLDWTSAGKNKEGLIKYFPIGIVAGIAPFNFPLNLAVHKIAPAIASGCPIILKPSSATTLSCLELAKIIDKTNLPKGAVSILPMNRETGNNLVTDERIKLLSFTGSPDVGWKMKANAGKKKVVLELGGNAGAIVSSSADLKLAISKCVYGAFVYSGQVCIHTQRIYVNKSKFDDFVAGFVVETKKLKFGNPDDVSTDVSNMIDMENAVRVEQWINEAIQAGAKLLSGGKRNDNYIEPTVLTNTSTTMKVNCEEVFGPVVVIESYTDFEKVIEEINNTTFGLQAGIFTDSQSEINYAFNNLEVGGVIVNDVPTFRVDHMPYGGIKDSGLGREGVRYAIQDMMEAKILVQ
ncbi:MAG: aldehyde dehydrogenase family protein [Bacteroidota bacterium]